MTVMLDHRAVDESVSPPHARVQTPSPDTLRLVPPVDSAPHARPPALVWADSGRGARPGASPRVPSGAQVVDLGAVEGFPLPGVLTWRSWSRCSDWCPSRRCPARRW